MEHRATAQERRAAIRDKANKLGIDEDYIAILVDSFYDHIRRDENIGPIFNHAIGDTWEPHLATMKKFWSSVALNSGEYSGKPVPKHQALSAVRPEHFQIWLNLFEQTLAETAPNSDVISYFMERAHRIAQSLELAMFGIPGLPVHRSNG